MTSGGPLVSVIVLMLNAERFLAEALDALEAQTYRPIEIVAVDGGSKDTSVSIASSRAAVSVFPQMSPGIAEGRNVGLDCSRGELVAFADADDICHPERIERQVKFLLGAGEPHGVLCRFRNFVDPTYPPPDWVNREIFLAERLGALPSLCTLLARRSVFAKVGRFRSQFEVGEDLDWFVRADDAGLAFSRMPDVLVDRRLHDSNMSSRPAGDHDFLLRIFRDSIVRKRAASPDTPAVSAPSDGSPEGSKQ
jgi:glycosyltransferase involved in cell wall biosynthesis